MQRLKIVLIAGGLAWGGLAPAQQYGEPADPVMAQLEQLRQIVLDQSQQMQALRGEVQRLVGDNEMARYKLEQIEKRQRDGYADLDERMRRLSGGQAAPGLPAQAAGLPAPLPGAAIPPPGMSGAATAIPPPAQPAIPAAPPVAQPAIPPPANIPPAQAVAGMAPANGAGQPQAAYDQAFNALQAGRYSEAISGFQSLLKSAPQGQYADNAQYWLGEAYYATRDFPAALKAFSAVVDNYPNTPKRSHALLKIGYVHYEMNNKAQARQVLEQVSKNYPGTATARLAEERLHKLSVEGY